MGNSCSFGGRFEVEDDVLASGLFDPGIAALRRPSALRGRVRSDVRIREDVCECLAYAEDLDVSEIEVAVKDGEVTLLGSVPVRRQKFRAAELSVEVAGVTEIHNHLRVRKSP